MTNEKVSNNESPPTKKNRLELHASSVFVRVRPTDDNDDDDDDEYDLIEESITFDEAVSINKFPLKSATFDGGTVSTKSSNKFPLKSATFDGGTVSTESSNKFPLKSATFDGGTVSTKSSNKSLLKSSATFDGSVSVKSSNKSPSKGSIKRLSHWSDNLIQIEDHHGTEDYTFAKKVLGPETTQETMYLSMLPEFVRRFTMATKEGEKKKGYNILFFAYGQKGSGKSHSIFGPESSLTKEELNDDWGIFPRVVNDVFNIMSERKRTDKTKFILTASAIEFYLGNCQDLLASNNPIRISEDFSPKGHVMQRLESFQDLAPFLAKVNANRAPQTAPDGSSSPSHCAIILTLMQADYSSGEGKFTNTTFTLVNFGGAQRPDKAGHERYSGSEVMMDIMAGREVQPGAQTYVTNWELFEIGSAVINATRQNKLGNKYVPPRQLVSPFLQYIAKCMDGSSFLGMLITISQAKKCGWETWFTMKYGADLSKLRTPVFAQRTVNIEKALEKAESDLKKAAEMLGKTPEINSPSSKYHARRTIDVKDQEQMIKFLRELAVPPEFPKIEIKMSKGPKQKPHSSSVYVRIKPASSEKRPTSSNVNQKHSKKKLAGWTDKSVTIGDDQGTEDFKFPRQVFGPEASQQKIYQDMLPNFVNSFTMTRADDGDGYDEAYNVLFFAYGQANSGKRHTIFGSVDSLDKGKVNKESGIFPLIVNDVLETMNDRAGTKFILTASAIEFYVGKCYDLLAGHNGIKISNFEPRGHTMHRVKSVQDLIPFLKHVEKNRSVRAKDKNGGASRSHCAIILTLLQLDVSSRQFTKTAFNLVDFAGAERPDKVNNNARMSGSAVMKDILAGKEISDGMQGFTINWELFEIGKAVVQANEQHRRKKKFVPPRQLASPFLQFIASCLDGSSLLGMVVTVSQAGNNGWETYFTMKYGTDLSKLRAPIRTQGSMDIRKALLSSELAVELAKELLEKTPKTGSPSSKYYVPREIDLREQEQRLAFLKELNDY